MYCDRIPIAGGVAIVSRGGRRPACEVVGCRGRADFQCDYPLKGKKAGKTCDRHLCERCRISQGGDRDYCPQHEAMAREKPDAVTD